METEIKAIHNALIFSLITNDCTKEITYLNSVSFTSILQGVWKRRGNVVLP